MTISARIKRIYHKDSNNYVMLKGRIRTIPLTEQLKFIRRIDETVIFTRLGAICLNYETAYKMYKLPYTRTVRLLR